MRSERQILIGFVNTVEAVPYGLSGLAKGEGEVAWSQSEVSGASGVARGH